MLQYIINVTNGFLNVRINCLKSHVVLCCSSVCLQCIVLIIITRDSHKLSKMHICNA